MSGLDVRKSVSPSDKKWGKLVDSDRKRPISFDFFRNVIPCISTARLV